jgi:hypothetical protein
VALKLISGARQTDSQTDSQVRRWAALSYAGPCLARVWPVSGPCLARLDLARFGPALSGENSSAKVGGGSGVMVALRAA